VAAAAAYRVCNAAAPTAPQTRPDIVGRHMEVCDRCAGSGEELADPAPSSRPSQGYAADLG
jgi:hypothetical protein